MSEKSASKPLSPRVLLLAAAAAAIVALSACNTVSGVGKDLQESSENVKDAIEN